MSQKFPENFPKKFWGGNFFFRLRYLRKKALIVQTFFLFGSEGEYIPFEKKLYIPTALA